jgi:hypothetical protein
MWIALPFRWDEPPPFKSEATRSVSCSEESDADVEPAAPPSATEQQQPTTGQAGGVTRGK